MATLRTETALAALLEEQEGVVSRRQVLARGLTSEQWDWLLASRWQAVLPGVALAHRGPLGWAGRARAALLHAGPGAALSGDAALHLHAPASWRAVPPRVIDVAVPPDRKRLSRDFCVLHRVSRIDDWLHPVRTPPQLRLPVAALHAAAWARTDRAAEWRLAAPVQQRLVTAPDLRESVGQMPRLRRRQLIRVVLDDVELGAHAQTELDFLALVRRAGVPMPDSLQHRLRAAGVRYLDVYWRKRRVAAEIDGAHHRDVGTWEADLLRGNDVQLSGPERVVLLRFTSGLMRHDGHRVVEQLRSALL